MKKITMSASKAGTKKTTSKGNVPICWEIQIGLRIRSLREERSVTLEQLSQQTGLTKGQLSRIENGKASSPVSTLTRIASALGVVPGVLFSKEEPKSHAVLVKKAERRVIVGRGSKLGHTYESLSFDVPFGKDFESYLMTIQEKKIDTHQNTFRHPGHELLFMLEGKMDYRHGADVYHLTPGDSLFFEGSIPHGPSAIFSPPVRFLSVISNGK
jgi:transcriptional regulator with XRE-family HTH domain